MMMGRGGFGGGGGGFGSMMRGGPGGMSLREAPKLKTSAWGVTKRLGGMLGSHRNFVFYALACILAGSVVQMMMPLAFKHVIDVTVPTGNVRELMWIGIGLTVAQALRYCFAFGERYY